MRIFLTAWLLALAAPSAAQDSDRVVRWQEDLDALATELPRKHVKPFHVLTEAAFREQAAALRQRLGELDDDRILVELARLVAALGDSHTRLALDKLATVTVPVRLVWWPDGLRIFGAPKEHAAAVGALVTAIEGRPLDEVVALVRSVEAWDNEGAMRTGMPWRLGWLRLLRALGIAEDSDGLTLTCRGDDGEDFELRLAAGQLGADTVFARPKQRCATDQRSRQWHAHEYLDADQVLYVQYNACKSDQQQDLDRFTDRLEELLDTQPVKALIIDLQYNGGGASLLGDMMFGRLARYEPLESKTHIYGIIGPQTFSSALLNAQRLQGLYGATLVGRPTGGRPAHFGEVRTFQLPHSKLTVQHSTKHFVHGDPDADALYPDVKAERTFADYSAGRDPVLEAILERVRGK